MRIILALLLSTTFASASTHNVTRCNIQKSPTPIYARVSPGGKPAVLSDSKDKTQIDSYLVDVQEMKTFKNQNWAHVVFDSYDVNEGWVEYKYLRNCHFIEIKD